MPQTASATMNPPRSVVLVNPPSAPGTTANREGAAGLGYQDPSPSGFFYPPQTLAHVAAALRQAGWSVRALDCVAAGWDVAEALGQLGQGDEPLLGVMVSCQTLEADLGFLRAVAVGQPQRAIIALGPSTRYLQSTLMGERLDAILMGEPELAFPAIAQTLLDSKSREGPRACWPQEMGIPGYDRHGFIADLDALPYPAWELLPSERYRFLSISTSRGCGDSCRYCPYVAAQGDRFRGRDPAAVVDELAWLAQRFAPDRVVFRDPVLAWDRDRLAAICQGILARGIRLNWECESRPEHFDPELLGLMERAGCRWIKIGIESASGRLLADLQRLPGATSAAAYQTHAKDVVRAAKALGMGCRTFIMVGLPGETDADLAETLDFVRHLEPTALNTKAFIPYPGIRLEGAGADEERPPSYEAFHALGRELDARATGKPSMSRRVRRWLARKLRGGRP